MKSATRRLNLLNYLWLLIIPLSYNFWSNDPALYHKFLLLDISLIAVTAILFWNKKIPLFVIRPTIIFLGLYAASVLLALVGLITNHVNYADGWFVWLHLAVFPVFVLLLLLTGNTEISERKNVAIIVSWLALASILIGFTQYLFEIYSSGFSLSACDAVKGTFANKNIFAEVMFLTLPFTFYAFITTRSKWYLALSFATIFMIGLSLSRAVLFAVFIASCLTAGLYFVLNFRKQFTAKKIFPTIISVLLLVFGGFWFLKHTQAGQHIALFYNYRNTINERHTLWQATIRLIKSYPIFGCGLGAWKILSMQYSMLGLRNYTTFFQQPHNDWLWIISEQGFISFAFLVAAWLFLIGLLLKNIFKYPSDAFNYCLLFGLTGYLVYSNFAFPRERAEHGIFLAFIAAFILSNDRKASIPLPRLSGFLLGLFLLFATWWATAKVINQFYISKALEYRMSDEIHPELEYLNKINPSYCTMDGTATPVAWYRGMFYYGNHDNGAALTEFLEAVTCNPYHAYSLANVGTCLSAEGQNDSAEQYFRRALLYSEGFPDAALNLCALKFNKGQIDSAAGYLSMANGDSTDVRYVKFLGVVTKALTRSIVDSSGIEIDNLLTEKFNSLEGNPLWQMNVFRKACAFKRPVRQQIWMDILWTLRYKDNRKEIADKYQELLHLPPL